jgi:hypothetical protein
MVMVEYIHSVTKAAEEDEGKEGKAYIPYKQGFWLAE